MTLLECIAAMEAGRRLHICVHDVSGILEHPVFRLDFGHKIHAAPYCDEAKRTAAGHACCIRHKERVNALAVRHGKPFCGYCPFGVYELAHPVVMRDKVVCIIYIGNLCPTQEKAIKRLLPTAKRVGADNAQLTALLQQCEQRDAATFLPLARLLADFIVSTAEKERFSPSDNEHWAVRQALAYAERYFDKDIRVTEMAALCNIHPQYFGRLFKQQTGMSFSTYLTGLRMRQAEKLLQSGASVTATATACGYNEVTYFSRMFRKYYGTSPAIYKKKALHTDVDAGNQQKDRGI